MAEINWADKKLNFQYGNNFISKLNSGSLTPIEGSIYFDSSNRQIIVGQANTVGNPKYKTYADLYQTLFYATAYLKNNDYWLIKIAISDITSEFLDHNMTALRIYFENGMTSGSPKDCILITDFDFASIPAENTVTAAEYKLELKNAGVSTKYNTTTLTWAENSFLDFMYLPFNSEDIGDTEGTLELLKTNQAIDIIGNARTASSLLTGRTLKVDLATTNASTGFTGEQNIHDIGVSGVLPIANGGTNANNSLTAITNLGGPSIKEAGIALWTNSSGALNIDALSNYGTFYSENSTMTSKLTDGTNPCSGKGFKLFNIRNYSANYDYQIATSSTTEADDIFLKIRQKYKENTTTYSWGMWKQVAFEDKVADDISSTIAALKFTDTADSTKYVSSVSEVDGIISVTRATFNPNVTIGAGTSSAAPTITFSVAGNDSAAKSITIATTGKYGVTKLLTSTTSTSESVAATPKSVKTAYDQAAAAITAIQGLDTSISNTSGKTLTSLTQTDGLISATFADINITKSQISDLNENDYVDSSLMDTLTNNRLMWIKNNKIYAGSHYADASHIAINSSSLPSTNLYVQGTFQTTGASTLQDIITSGNIRRYYGTASSEPMITALSKNQDIYLFEVGHGTEIGSTTTSNHYKLLYKGTESTPNNYLQLIAYHTTNGETTAIQVNENGEVTFTKKVNADISGTAAKVVGKLKFGTKTNGTWKYEYDGSTDVEVPVYDGSIT